MIHIQQPKCWTYRGKSTALRWEPWDGHGGERCHAICRVLVRRAWQVVGRLGNVKVSWSLSLT